MKINFTNVQSKLTRKLLAYKKDRSISNYYKNIKAGDTPRFSRYANHDNDCTNIVVFYAVCFLTILGFIRLVS